MTHAFTMPLTDAELRPLLEAGEGIAFVGKVARWQQIERQVERLGFGDLYVVTFTQGKHEPKILVKPRGTA